MTLLEAIDILFENDYLLLFEAHEFDSMEPEHRIKLNKILARYRSYKSKAGGKYMDKHFMCRFAQEFEQMLDFIPDPKGKAKIQFIIDALYNNELTHKIRSTNRQGIENKFIIK